MAPIRKFFVVLMFQLGALWAISWIFLDYAYVSQCRCGGNCKASGLAQNYLRYDWLPLSLLFTLHTNPCSQVLLKTGTWLVCILLRSSSELDFAYLGKDALTPTVYWPMVESSLGVVGACLPLIKPLFTDTSARRIPSRLRAILSLSALRNNNANTPSTGRNKPEAGESRAHDFLQMRDNVEYRTNLTFTSSV